MNPFVDAYIRAHQAISGERLLTTFQNRRTPFVEKDPQLPKIDAQSVHCRLTVCPRDCSIADLCISNDDGHF